MSKVRADNYSNRLGTGAPDFPDGLRVTGTAATFSGNVSIAGTLTYQDVNNIDSIGIITAQQGIQVLANGLDVTGFSTFKTGVSVTGVVTATSYSGSGANLTGIDAAPSFTGIASGSLTDGQAVVLTDDGKITGVTTTVAIGTSEVGPPSVFYLEGSTEYISSGYDSHNDRIVVSFKAGGNGDNGLVAVGEVNGKSIKYGQYVVLFDDNFQLSNVVYDSNSRKIVVIYQDNNSHGYAAVGTVDPLLNTITFGDAVVFNAASTSFLRATFDSTNNKVVISYRDNGNSSYGTAIVGTVSGDTITFGSEVVFASATLTDNDIVFDSNSGKVVVVYRKSPNSYGDARVGTVSGTSISFGTEAAFYANKVPWNVRAGFDSTNNKVVVSFGKETTYWRTAVVGTVSGTDITFGTPVTYRDSSGEGSGKHAELAFDTRTGEMIFVYPDQGNSSHLSVTRGSVTGTAITFTNWTPEVIDLGSSIYAHAVYVPTFEKVVAGSSSNGAYSDDGVTYTYSSNTKTSTLTHENFLGFSNAAYSDGDSAKIQLVGSIDDAQSGLTTGRKYYVHIDGSLGTTPDSPSVSAGLAITDTKLYVR